MNGWIIVFINKNNYLMRFESEEKSLYNNMKGKNWRKQWDVVKEEYSEKVSLYFYNQRVFS